MKTSLKMLAIPAIAGLLSACGNIDLPKGKYALDVVESINLNRNHFYDYEGLEDGDLAKESFFKSFYRSLDNSASMDISSDVTLTDLSQGRLLLGFLKDHVKGRIEKKHHLSESDQHELNAKMSIDSSSWLVLEPKEDDQFEIVFNQTKNDFKIEGRFAKLIKIERMMPKKNDVVIDRSAAIEDVARAAESFEMKTLSNPNGFAFFALTHEDGKITMKSDYETYVKQLEAHGKTPLDEGQYHYQNMHRSEAIVAFKKL